MTEEHHIDHPGPPESEAASAEQLEEAALAVDEERAISTLLEMADVDLGEPTSDPLDDLPEKERNELRVQLEDVVNAQQHAERLAGVLPRR